MKNIILFLFIFSILLHSCQSNNTDIENSEENYLDVDTLTSEEVVSEVSYEYEDSSLIEGEEYAYPKMDANKESVVSKTTTSNKNINKEPKPRPKNSSTKSKIYFDNPSFEFNSYGHSTAPSFWKNTCKFPYESPPDVHLSENGNFGVKNKSNHGNQFLGLVTRDNNTYEAIFQKLFIPLEKDKEYAFSLYLTISDSYESLSKTTMMDETFNAPTILRVWGGKHKCDQSFLIYESPPITHDDWKKYKIEFTAQKDIPFISLEAFYTDVNTPKNGNILIDNISPIIKK